MKIFRHIYKIVFVALVAFTISCDDDSDNDFSITPSLGFTSLNGSVREDASIKVGFYSNTTYTEAVTVTVAVNNFQNLVYGTDYVTEPEPVNNVITVTLDPDNEEPAFTVYPLVTGESRKIAFQITSVSGGNLQLAQEAARTYVLTIAEALEGGTVTITEDFDDCATSGVPDGFTQFYETDYQQSHGWACQAYGMNSTSAPRANAYSSSTAGALEVRAWLIMDAITVPSGATVTIDLWTYSQYSGNGGAIDVKWSKNYSGSGDPTTSTWTSLTDLNSKFPTGGSRTWTEVSGSYTNISGDNVYLAFHFTGGLLNSSNAFDIDDLTITIE